ncbi:hypothetical protein ACFSHR_04365 [Azotobacter chroococcum]
MLLEQGFLAAVAATAGFFVEDNGLCSSLSRHGDPFGDRTD